MFWPTLIDPSSFRRLGRMRRSTRRSSMRIRALLVACFAAALSAQPVGLVSCSKTKMQKGNR
jgi:hypothetical protein